MIANRYHIYIPPLVELDPIKIRKLLCTPPPSWTRFNFLLAFAPNANPCGTPPFPFMSPKVSLYRSSLDQFVIFPGKQFCLICLQDDKHIGIRNYRHLPYEQPAPCTVQSHRGAAISHTALSDIRIFPRNSRTFRPHRWWDPPLLVYLP